MNDKKTLVQILQQDSKVRFLLGGIVVDGMMLVALVVVAGVLLAL